MKKNNYLIGVALLLLPLCSFAGSMDVLHTSLQTAIASATAALQTTAILWLSTFVLIQFLITNIGLLKSGADMEAVIGKFMGSMLWFGFCFYVMANGTDFITKVGGGFFKTATTMAGATSFDAAAILDDACGIAANLVSAISKASGWTNLFLPSLLGGLMGVVILAAGALIAFKVFLIKIELMIIVMMAPLSFSFLGLNALKDQGIAPFKALISLLYRVLLLALILKTMDGMTDNLVNVISTINPDSIDGIWSVVFGATIGYVLLAFLVFKSDSIASSLASGSTNLGTADVASAAALGAAAGAAATSGGTAMAKGAGAAAALPKAMSEVIGNMIGQGASSIANASSQGAGVTPSPAPSRPASMSTAGGSSAGGALAKSGGAGSGAPTRPVAADGGGSAPQKTVGAASASTSAPGRGSPQNSAGSSPAPTGTAQASSAKGPGMSTQAGSPAGSVQDTPSAANSAAGDSTAGQSAMDAAPMRDSAQQGADTAANPTAGQNAVDSGLAGGGSGMPDAAGSASPPNAGPSGASTGAPVRPSTSGAADADAKGAPRRSEGKDSPGSGASAAIAGPANPLDQKVDQLVEAMAKAQQKQQPGLKDHLKELNRHVEGERAHTQVSINTHHSD